MNTHKALLLLLNSNLSNPSQSIHTKRKLEIFRLFETHKHIQRNKSFHKCNKIQFVSKHSPSTVDYSGMHVYHIKYSTCFAICIIIIPRIQLTHVNGVLWFFENDLLLYPYYYYFYQLFSTLAFTYLYFQVIGVSAKGNRGVSLIIVEILIVRHNR